MAAIRSLMEMTPEELISRPAVRNFSPFREQIIRFGWFKWYWLGRSMSSAHTLLIGPFRTKRGAKLAWAKVPDKDPRHFYRDDAGKVHYVEPAPPPGDCLATELF